MESTVIQNMVDNIIGGQQADAMDLFNQIVSDKLSTALADKKIEIASTLGQIPHLQIDVKDDTEEETEIETDENLQ